MPGTLTPYSVINTKKNYLRFMTRAFLRRPALLFLSVASVLGLSCHDDLMWFDTHSFNKLDCEALNSFFFKHNSFSESIPLPVFFRTAVEYRKLIGHSGPVFSTSFNNDNSFLLSSSADRTGTYYLSFLSP